MASPNFFNRKRHIFPPLLSVLISKTMVNSYMQYLGLWNPSGTKLLSSIWKVTQVKPNFCPPYERQPKWNPTFVLYMKGNPSETQVLSSIWKATQAKPNFCPPPYEGPPYKKEGSPLKSWRRATNLGISHEENITASGILSFRVPPFFHFPLLQIYTLYFNHK